MKKTARSNEPCPCGSGKKYKHCCFLREKIPEANTHSITTSVSRTFQEAIDHHQAGRLAQAEAAYRQILQIDSNQPGALHLLGMLAQQAGRNEIAVELIGKALSVKPDYSEARSNLELVLKEQGRMSEINGYRNALTCKPDLAEAHNNLGIAFQNNDLAVPLPRIIDYAFYPRVPVISLELTNNCNLKCPYCANGALTRPKTYIEWALLEKIVDECAEMQYDLAWLHGVGEPLLWDRLEEVVALIKRKGAGTGSFATNGTLLRPDRVRRLLDAGLDSIYVSIDTLDSEIYKNTRGGKLEKVIHNIQEMIRIVPTSFQITVALMNHKDHHITEKTIQQFHQIFGYHENVRTNLVRNSRFPSAPSDYRIDINQQTQGCKSPVDYLFIALDGRAAICCVDQDVLHSLGNVAERSICDIWFDHKNQTTFRNIALGVHECPDVCIQKCVLLPPRQNVNLTSPGYGLPFDDAARFAYVLSQNGGNIIASSIFRELIHRDPANQTVRAILKNL
jgi:MoaA/NifB/PqqE/SkfB family radical SAM enzyme